MAGITDTPFRERLRRWGCEAMSTEMISAPALVRNHRGTAAMVDPPDRDDNMAVQLSGVKPDELEEGALRLAAIGWKRLDFNMGCPVRKVVASGGGAGHMRNLALAARCISALRKTSGVILTVKMRSGWSPSEENFIEAGRMAEECGADGITLHPRFRSQGYSGVADWSKVAALAEAVKVPVAGSGDVGSAEEAVKRLSDFPVAAVMIGRAALSEPWLFRDAARLLAGEKPAGRPSAGEISADLLLQYDRLLELKGEGAAVGEIKKFTAWALKGFEMATHKRKEVMEIKDAARMRLALVSLRELEYRDGHSGAEEA
jgi:nifR3 family TIM-barrel protein